MELNAQRYARPLRRQVEPVPSRPSLRRRFFAFAAVLLAAVAIACGGSDSDDDSSQASDPTATQAASEATAAPTESAAADPSPTAEAAATATPAPTDVPPTPTEEPEPTEAPPTATVVDAGPQPVTVNISAANIAYSTTAISVPANTLVTIVFDNTDTGVPHDFGVSIPGTARTDICNGPCTDSITFNSGSAGTFEFQCSVHPEMRGSFTVQ
jgi:plastocyanin